MQNKRLWTLYPIISLTVALLLLPVVSGAAVEIQTWNTKTGAKVLFVQAKQLPMVDIRILFDAGSARDEAKPGLAFLTNRLLVLGAGGKSATQIAEDFENVGAKQENGAQQDAAWLSLRSLTDPKLLNVSLNTLQTLLLKPDFNEQEFQRERDLVLIGLRSEEQNPESIAKRRFFLELYKDHPYAHLPLGTAEGVNTITRADIVGFYKRYYVARNAVIAIVGAVTETQAKSLAEKLTSGLAPGEVPAPLPEVKPLLESKLVRIKHPSSQTHIIMGHPSLTRGDPDYFALYLGNHVLGGSGLVSRINEEIREKRGLSYTAVSYFEPMRKAGPFFMSMQTKNERSEEGLTVLRETLAKYLKTGMTTKEHAASVKNITGSFPLRIDNNNKIVEYLGVIGFFNLPTTYLRDFNKNIEALSVEKINETFRRRVHPEKMVTVIVGG